VIMSGPPSHRLDYCRRIEDWVTAYTERSGAGPRRRPAGHPARDLQGRLETLIATNRVPGAAVAVFADGELTESAAGVLNVETGVRATPDSVFQLGSVGKVW